MNPIFRVHVQPLRNLSQAVQLVQPGSPEWPDEPDDSQEPQVEPSEESTRIDDDDSRSSSSPSSPAGRPAAKQKAKKATKKGVQKQLDDDDKLLIIRLAEENSELYGHISDKAFWKHVAGRLEAQTGKTHKSLARMVGAIVKERCQFLEALESGEQDDHSSMAQAIDDWIKILDNRKLVLGAKSAAKGTKDAETAASIAWRTASLAKWADKKQLRTAVQSITDESDATVPIDSSTDPEEIAGSSSTIQGTRGSIADTPRARCKRQRAATVIAEDDEFNKDFRRLVDHVVGQNTSRKTVDERLDGLEAGLSEILALLKKGD